MLALHSGNISDPLIDKASPHSEKRFRLGSSLLQVQKAGILINLEDSKNEEIP